MKTLYLTSTLILLLVWITLWDLSPLFYTGEINAIQLHKAKVLYLNLIFSIVIYICLKKENLMTVHPVISFWLLRYWFGSYDISCVCLRIILRDKVRWCGLNDKTLEGHIEKWTCTIRQWHRIPTTHIIYIRNNM